jgi:adenylosuccinate synthase
LDKLQVIRETLLEEFAPLCPAGSAGALTKDFQFLQDKSAAGKWLAACRALARQCPPAAPEAIHTQVTQPGSVLFEGAQGVLLDEWRGFHPHTTWSSINTTAVECVAARFGIEAPIEHYGVLRSYLTRHGAGPLPTHDESLDARLPEPHNQSDGWQGRFRRGHPDAVLLRYALESVGALSGLFIGHLDVFQRGITLKWCESYTPAAMPPSVPDLTRLPLGPNEDLSHQSMLTRMLFNAQPHYAPEVIGSAAAFLDRIASITDLSVSLRSYGATFAEVREQ